MQEFGTICGECGADNGRYTKNGFRFGVASAAAMKRTAASVKRTSTVALSHTRAAMPERQLPAGLR